MKKITCLLLTLLLLLTGCRAGSGSETTDAPDQTTVAPTVTTVPPETDPPEVTLPETEPPVTTLPPMEGSLGFANPGKVRIGYQGSRSYVRYITSADQLPDEEALAGYDAAFFAEHALLIVVETVSSGSMQLELSSVTVSGSEATVTLSREMPGDVGTADMATWLLWAEVEKGLNYTWTLEGREPQFGGESY